MSDRRNGADRVYPEAYIEYLAHFHGDRDYFECHEVLEEYWKAHPDDPLQRVWVGLIQAAVSLYHERRGNVRGAVKMAAGALDNLPVADLPAVGLDAAAFRAGWSARLERLRGQEAAGGRTEPAGRFADFTLPLADPALEARCRLRCRELGCTWGAPSDLANEALVERHRLRDRSDVIAERHRQHARKREERGETAL